MSLSKSGVREFTGDPVNGGIDGVFHINQHDLQISVSRSARRPSVRVIPHNNHEASLETARTTEISQHGDRLTVRLPRGKNGISSNTMMIGGNAVVNGVRYQGPVTIVNGVVYSGHGASEAMNSGVRVEVVLPEGSSARIDAISGNSEADGPLEHLQFKSVSGDVQASEVRSVSGDTTSGYVELGVVQEGGSVKSVSGSVEVANYNGRDLSVSAVSGDVYVTAGSGAQGTISLSTVSGNVTTRNTRGRPGLRVRPSTVSGRVREN